MAALIVGFFLTAVLYAMVGFGGGSTYNALLVLTHTDYRLLPVIALSCNIIVVLGGAYHFSKAERTSWHALIPFVCLSVPMAWLGGLLAVSERVFVGLLGLALLLTAISMFVQQPASGRELPEERGKTSWALALPLGGAIGLLSGIVGIGGGIFLAPVLHLMKWGSARAIAAASSVFILVNSIAGLAGHMIKLADLGRLGELWPYWLLLPTVLVGGQIGSRLGSRRLPARWIRFLTGVLILYVALRLLWRWYGSG